MYNVHSPSCHNVDEAFRQKPHRINLYLKPPYRALKNIFLTSA
jgi:hypothetical protein